MLVESSAWVLVLHGYAELPDDVATCPPVMQEILQGAGGAAHFDALRAMLQQTTLLDAPVPLVRYEEAAALYMRCRDAGVTVRKSVDCLIAACAIAHGVELLHNDRDFDHIALVAPLRAIRVTRS